MQGLPSLTLPTEETQKSNWFSSDCHEIRNKNCSPNSLHYCASSHSASKCHCKSPKTLLKWRLARGCLTHSFYTLQDCINTAADKINWEKKERNERKKKKKRKVAYEFHLSEQSLSSFKVDNLWYASRR